MTPLPLIGTGFWKEIDRLIVKGDGVAHCNDGDLQYAALRAHMMTVLLRTQKELFSVTVNRMVREKGLLAAINGSFYDVGYVTAAFGGEPQDTKPVGLVLDEFEGIRTGSPSPGGFYIQCNPPSAAKLAATSAATNIHGSPEDVSREMANVLSAWRALKASDCEYVAGLGDPSGGCAIGGLGPVIITGPHGRVKYGHGNVYKPETVVPPGSAPPPPAHDPGPYWPYLLQRNSEAFQSMASKGVKKGKVVLAYCANEKKLLLLVLPDASPTGVSMEVLRDKLWDLGVDNAVFLDGSDSAMLCIRTNMVIPPGSRKDEFTTVGLGFY
jgi:hypothetical protein